MESSLFKVFTNVDGLEVDAYTTPVILYARLTQSGGLPVLSASVTAYVYRPGGSEGDQAGQPIKLTMRDDGAGSPDITKADGIYSVHFSDLSAVPGFYSVQVTAEHNGGMAKTVKQAEDLDENGKRPEGKFWHFSESLLGFMFLMLLYLFLFAADNCCGSRVRYRETIPASPFHRQTVGPGFYIRQGLSPRTDIAPPSRVLDFHVAKIVQDSLYVQLEWSAPGGDYDQGKGNCQLNSLK